jgi:serine/threonine protein phosphatase PrpC
MPLFRPIRTLAAAAAILLLSLAAPAQPPITLANSIAPLPGPWRFIPGDSPTVNGTLLYAEPSLNDSAWTLMDLSSQPTAEDPGYGTPGYIPGWTGKGFPNLTGFAWYRLRIRVANPNQPLALKMPDHVDDAYQVFANGQLVGSFGVFTPAYVVCYRARPTVVTLPPAAPDGTIVLAVRFFEESWVGNLATAPDAGGMHESPLIGLPAEIESLRRREVSARLLSVLPSTFVSLFLLIAAAGAFWIWLLARSQRPYLWLTLALVATALPALIFLVTLFTLHWSQDTEGCINVTAGYLQLLFWILFWKDWFDLRMTPVLRAVLIVASLASTPVQIFGYVRQNELSVQASLHALQVVAVAKGLLGALIFVNVIRGARKDRTGALLALPPVLLLTFSAFNAELLDWARIRTTFFPFGLEIALGDISSLLLVLVVGALVARRFIASQVSQKLARRTVDQDLEQARELQQRVLIPEPIDSALFEVQTEYQPARTVGGDFFQVIPHPDGSLLLVVGDVSGKGMAAAMLVAVLVGAIRTRADETFAPDAILGTLNDRLLGRAGGHFATCLVAHLRPGGVLTLANAGHIPPFRNGAAIDLPGSLPLGLLAEVDYDTHTLQLQPGDRLTLLTDGIPEARNAAGHLLGFDRLAELSMQSPQFIAEAAISHGQDDDITIVSVTLLPNARPDAVPSSYAAAPA